MIPIKYMSKEEKYVLRMLQSKLQRENSISELILIEKALEDLLRLSFRRYKRQKKCKTFN